MSNDFYTVQEVAERFRVSDKAVYKWIKQNKIEWERTSPNSRDIRIPKGQFVSPPTETEVSDLEKAIFGDAVEMKLITPPSRHTSPSNTPAIPNTPSP